MVPNTANTRPTSHTSNLSTLLIERATAEHVPYLRRLKEQVMQSRYRPAEDEANFQRWREHYCTDEYFLDLLNDPSAMLLCIGSLREPVGMVALRRMGDSLEIDDLLCLHSRTGDGSRLLTSALCYAEAWRLNDVYVDIYPGYLEADQFLKRHGFSQDDETATNDLGAPMHRYRRSVRAQARRTS